MDLLRGGLADGSLHVEADVISAVNHASNGDFGQKQRASAFSGPFLVALSHVYPFFGAFLTGFQRFLGIFRRSRRPGQGVAQGYLFLDWFAIPQVTARVKGVNEEHSRHWAMKQAPDEPTN